MPIDSEIEAKFEKIAQLMSIELSGKLSSILNRPVMISFSRIIDPVMSGAKIVIKKDSFLLSSPIAEPQNLGPLSLLASPKQVFVIADMVMGGDALANDDVKPDDTNQMVFAETIQQVIVALIERLKSLKSDLVLQLGNHDFRPLQSIKEATLKKPEGVEDSLGLGFKIKIGSKLDEVFHFEINSAAIEYIVSEFNEIIESIDATEFEAKVRAEYLPDTNEENTETEVAVVEDTTTDAYKVNEKRNLGFLKDISLELIIELGRAELTLTDVLKLTKGSAIELEKACNEPVDLYIHNQLVARGEVVAIDDNFGIKITGLVGNLNLAKQLGLAIAK